MIRAIDVVYYPARDLPAMLKWYGEALTGESSFGTDEGGWQELRLREGTATFAVSRASGDGKSQPGAVFITDSLADDRACLISRGAIVSGEPMDVGPSIVAAMKDPEGNGFYLVQSKRGNVALLEEAVTVRAGIERVWPLISEPSSLARWIGCSALEFEAVEGTAWRG